MELRLSNMIAAKGSSLCLYLATRMVCSFKGAYSDQRYRTDIAWAEGYG